MSEWYCPPTHHYRDVEHQPDVVQDLHLSGNRKWVRDPGDAYFVLGVKTGQVEAVSGEMEARDEEAGHVDEDDDDDDQVEVEELRSPVEWQAGLTVEAGGGETVVTGNVGQDLTAVSGGVEQGDHQGDQGWDTLHTTAVTR